MPQPRPTSRLGRRRGPVLGVPLRRLRALHGRLRLDVLPGRRDHGDRARARHRLRVRWDGPPVSRTSWCARHAHRCGSARTPMWLRRDAASTLRRSLRLDCVATLWSCSSGMASSTALRLHRAQPGPYPDGLTVHHRRTRSPRSPRRDCQHTVGAPVMWSDRRARAFGSAAWLVTSARTGDTSDRPGGTSPARQP